MKTCKLEYMLRNMNVLSKKELIGLMNKVANDFFGVKSFCKYVAPIYIKPVAYPILLEEDEAGGFNVTVPDIFGGVTCADDYNSAIEMAKDMIRLMLKEAPGQCFPPKTLEETKSNFPDKIVVMVEVDCNEN